MLGRIARTAANQFLRNKYGKQRYGRKTYRPAKHSMKQEAGVRVARWLFQKLVKR